MVVGGIIVAFAFNEGVGESIVGGAAIVALGNWMLRLNSDDADERGREEAAREFYDEHGRWPDDAG